MTPIIKTIARISLGNFEPVVSIKIEPSLDKPGEQMVWLNISHDNQSICNMFLNQSQSEELLSQLFNAMKCFE
jgi:hypothetical protein